MLKTLWLLTLPGAGSCTRAHRKTGGEPWIGIRHLGFDLVSKRILKQKSTRINVLLGDRTMESHAEWTKEGEAERYNGGLNLIISRLSQDLLNQNLHLTISFS